MTPGSGMPARFPWRPYGVVLVLIVVLASVPLISVLVSSAIAEAHGCRLDEGSVHPCIVLGADWGQALYTMGVLGWLMLASFPLGLGAVIVWFVMLIIHRLAWGRAQRKKNDP